MQMINLVFDQIVQLLSLFKKSYSEVFIIGDNAQWSIDVDARDLHKMLSMAEIESHILTRTPWNIPQVVHYNSQFSLMLDIYKNNHRISVDYYHGKPEQGESFKKCFDSLCANHEKISKVRVSTKEMEELIKSSGIESKKVMRIPIGIDTDIFSPKTDIGRQMMRKRLGIPEKAYVVGSFQKDGVGWGQGLEPKLIKGPDVFLNVIEKLNSEIPNLPDGKAGLWVLLSGPARGFVKNGLDKIRVPYRHQFLNNLNELSDFYEVIDLYIICSREEGGPKACLESMAKGVPLVTTAVGQCKDLVAHGENAMMAPVDDVESLYKYSIEILKNPKAGEKLIKEGFKTAINNSHQSQIVLWKQYFKNLIA